MKIAISNDKGAHRLKEAIVGKLRAEGYQLIDMGTKEPGEEKSHTAAGAEVAQAVQRGEADRGILLCGTGTGVALTANKYHGVYAAVAESVFAARHCRLINDCNVLCLGAYILGEYMALEMVDVFLRTEFAEYFDPIRAEKLKKQINCIAEIESKNFSKAP